MLALHRCRGNYLRLAGAAAAVRACMVLFLFLCWPSASFAQSKPSATSTTVPDILIHSTVPGATPWAEPGPSNTVPEWAEQSYDVFLQMKARANGGTVYTRSTAAQMPDWSGIWSHEGGATWDGFAVSRQARGGGTDRPAIAHAILADCQSFPCKGWLLAALTPRYELLYREKLAAVAHNVEWDPDTACVPAGFPRTMIEPFGRTFIDTPQETWTIGFVNNDIRRIYTDGRGHLPQDEAYPLFDGDSIGFWDRDTLVVHTLYMRGGELQRVQPSFSEEASVVERIRMTGPNTIVDDATIYDPLALREPWHGVQTYSRMTAPHNAMNMYSCDANVYQTPEGGTGILLPGDSVTITLHYQDLADEQNLGLDKIYAYGAKILHEQHAPSKKADNAR